MKTSDLMLNSPIVDEVNRLARDLYCMHGEYVAETFKFYLATTSLATYCWNVAVVTYFNSAVVDIENAEELIGQYLMEKAHTELEHACAH